MKYLFLALSLSMVLFVGCGGTDARIRTEMVVGTITLNGIPLSNATITFHPQSGSEVASGLSKDDGTFVVTSQNGATGKGAVAGEYAITVSKSEITFVTVETAAGPISDAVYGPQLIPAQYLDKTKTPLKVEVKKGKNTIQLDVVSK